MPYRIVGTRWSSLNLFPAAQPSGWAILHGHIEHADKDKGISC